MSDQKHSEAEFDRIDADAVCEACGTVNPEETLFCKACGNNLRDQRVNRITEGRGAEDFSEAVQPVQWLSKGLGALGILVVIWTAINASNGNIEHWLTSTEHTLVSGPGPSALWKGADSPVYDDLYKQVAGHTVTVEEIAGAASAPPSDLAYQGLYFLKSSNAASAAIIGQAAVKEDGDRVFFVAKMSRGAEIRGELEVGGASPKTIIAGIRIGGDVLPVYGMAQKLKDGVFACYGQQRTEEEDSEDSAAPSVSAVAIRIPSS